MKYSRQIAFFLSFALSISSMHITRAVEDEQHENNTVAETAYLHELAQEVDNLLQESYRFLTEIDRAIEQLALLTSNHQFKNISNKGNVINALRETRMFITGTLRDQAQLNALQNYTIEQQLALRSKITFILLDACDELVAYLNNAIKTNLKNLKPFDVRVLQKRSPVADLSFDMIREKTEATHKSIINLKKSVDTAGLTWYNIAARTFENWIVNPAVKYNVPQIAAIGGLTASLAFYTLWKYGHEGLPTWFPDGLKNYTKNGLYERFGMPATYSQITGQRINIKEGTSYSTLAIVDNILADVLTPRNIPFIALTGGTALAAYKGAWSVNVKPWLTKRSALAWNFMRGGAYAQNSVNGSYDFIPEYNFDDLIGLDEIKDVFYPLIHFLDNPEQYLRVHAAPEAGYILTGPTRTGKTYSVECLCGEIMRMLKKRGRGAESEFKFWKIDAAIINQFGIKDILETAKAHAPVILFIDEIDLLGLQRVGNNQLLSQFLVSMGNALDKDPSKQVILIAATNQPQTLDSALRQYGRLGKEIRFEYPALKYRKSFIIRELHNMALDIAEFDIDSLAHKTDGKSFEELRAMIRNAIFSSWKNSRTINQALLEESIDTELNKIIMTDRRELSNDETYVLASHFAGRSLAMMLLNTQKKLDKVTIKAVMPSLREELVWEQYNNVEDKNKQAKIEYGALFTKNLTDTIGLSSPEQLINEIKVLLAGFVAEEILLGSCTYKCHSKDSDRAYMLIESLVLEGLDQKKLAKSVRESLESKAYGLFIQYKQEIKQLLSSNKVTLEALARELQSIGIMDEKAVKAVIANPTQRNDIATIVNDALEIETKAEAQPAQA